MKKLTHINQPVQKKHSTQTHSLTLTQTNTNRFTLTNTEGGGGVRSLRLCGSRRFFCGFSIFPKFWCSFWILNISTVRGFVHFCAVFRFLSNFFNRFYRNFKWFFEDPSDTPPRSRQTHTHSGTRKHTVGVWIMFWTLTHSLTCINTYTQTLWIQMNS